MKNEFKCPSGHIVKTEELHSYVKLDVEDIYDAVVFDCPGGKRGHVFTLRKAVAAGMFTDEEAAKIAEQGRRHKAEYALELKP